MAPAPTFASTASPAPSVPAAGASARSVPAAALGRLGSSLCRGVGGRLVLAFRPHRWPEPQVAAAAAPSLPTIPSPLRSVRSIRIHSRATNATIQLAVNEILMIFSAPFPRFNTTAISPSSKDRTSSAPFPPKCPRLVKSKSSGVSVTKPSPQGRNVGFVPAQRARPDPRGPKNSSVRADRSAFRIALRCDTSPIGTTCTWRSAASSAAVGMFRL